MLKTDPVELDMDLITEGLYDALLKEFNKTRPNITYINDIKVSAIIEYEE